MNVKRLLLCITPVVGLATGSAQAADPLSFNYIGFDYVISGDTTFDISTGVSEDFDLTRGYAIKGAFELGDVFFVTGETLQLDYDDAEGMLGVISASEALALNDYTFIGAGAHMPVGEVVEVYGAV